MVPIHHRNCAPTIESDRGEELAFGDAFDVKHLILESAMGIGCHSRDVNSTPDQRQRPDSHREKT